MSQTELLQLKEIVECLIDHSQSAIIRNNFVKNFYNYTVDGYLQGKYKLFGTKTFRLTSNSPNLLQLPSTGSIYAKPVKQCFVAKPGKIFYAVDYSGLEERVLANLSRDENKCAIFLDKVDSHCLNSYTYFKDEIEKELPKKDNESLQEYVQRYKKEVSKGNTKLNDIRQKSKRISFGLNYGCGPAKVAEYIKEPEEVGKEIHNKYHNELYKDVTKMRKEIENQTILKGRVHLGLGCYMYCDNVRFWSRTLFNACSQFWSILSLLTVNKFHHILDKENLNKRIQVISSIYDSIYIHMDDDVELIKWVNDTIIPIMLTDYLEDIIIPNEAIGEIGYNWQDLLPMPNNASLEEIKEVHNGLQT